MSKNINATLGLLGLLIVTFVVKPNILQHAFNTLLGRIVLIALIVHFSRNNMFLGLFVAIFLILGINLNKMVEGFEVPQAKTVGDDTQPGTKTKEEDKIKVLTSSAAKGEMGPPTQSKPAEIPAQINIPTDVQDVMENVNQKRQVLMENLKELAKKYNLCELCQTSDVGVDRQTVEESIRPVKPSTIPVSKNDFKSGDNIAPSDNAVEAFSGMCASCM
jgi:hypothetical protein